MKDEKSNSVLERAKTRMIGKKAPEKLIDYLTPMRYQREFVDSLKGKNKVNIQEIKGRARIRKVASQKK